MKTRIGVPFAQWDEAALAQRLADPVAVKPDTAMTITDVSNPQTRQDIIACLKQLCFGEVEATPVDCPTNRRPPPLQQHARSRPWQCKIWPQIHMTPAF